MKLFSGGGGHNSDNKKTRNTAQQKIAHPPTQFSGSQPAPNANTPTGQPVRRNGAAPKPTNHRSKKKKTVSDKQRRGRRIVVAIMIVLALLLAGTATAVYFLVRPPEIVQPKNDPTIKDPENGDKVDMNSLLNSGTRIDDVFTFIVGAVDEDGTRTDALMVARMDTKEKSINVMNIPRDTMCNNNQTEANKKINAAYGMKKGIEQTKIEIERIMGFQPDKYVIVNFEGIEAIVDAIGGIEYEVPFRMEYDDPSQNLHIDLYAGNQTLNGKKTVEFLRWRHNNDYSVQYLTGDEGRVETQQKFLKAAAKQVLQMKNVPKIKEIVNAVFENVKTDFTAGELLWMGMQAVQFDSNNLQFFTLPGYGQMSTAGTSLPLSFFFPYEKETLELVNKYFNPFEEPISNLSIVSGPAGSSGVSYQDYDYDSGENYVWSDTSGNYNDTNDDDDDDDNEQSSTGTGRPSGGGNSSGGNSGNGNSGGNQWVHTGGSNSNHNDYNDRPSNSDSGQNNSDGDDDDDNNGYNDNESNGDDPDNDNSNNNDDNYSDNDNNTSGDGDSDNDNNTNGDGDSDNNQSNDDNGNSDNNADSNENEGNQYTEDPEGEQGGSDEPAYTDDSGVDEVGANGDSGETSDPEG